MDKENKLLEHICYEYDNKGNLVRQIDKLYNSEISYVYDLNNNNIVQINHNNNEVCYYIYNDKNLLIKEISSNLVNNNDIIHQYDKDNRLVRTICGDTVEEINHYNESGLLILNAIHHYDINETFITRYVYDKNNHIINKEILDKDIKTLKKYEYTGDLLLKEYVDGNIAKHIIYDNNKPKEQRMFDTNGMLASKTFFNYDNKGRVSLETTIRDIDNLVYKRELKYDDNDNVIELKSYNEKKEICNKE